MTNLLTFCCKNKSYIPWKLWQRCRFPLVCQVLISGIYKSVFVVSSCRAVGGNENSCSRKVNCTCARVCLLPCRRRFANLQAFVVSVKASAEVKLNNKHTLYCLIPNACLVINTSNVEWRKRQRNIDLKKTKHPGSLLWTSRRLSQG